MARNQSLPAHLQEKDSRGVGKLKFIRTPRKTHRLSNKA